MVKPKPKVLHVLGQWRVLKRCCWVGPPGKWGSVPFGDGPEGWDRALRWATKHVCDEHQVR